MPIPAPEPLKDLANEEREERENLVSREWKEKAGAVDLFDHFTQKEGEEEIIVTAELLDDYVKPILERDRTLFERKLKEQMDNRKNDDPKIRAKANKQINALIDYLNERNSVVTQSREDLEEFYPEHPEAAPVLTSIYENGRRVMGNAIDGFSNASLGEKAMMLAGVYVSFLVIRKSLDLAFKPSQEGDHWSKKGIKKVFRVVLGGAGIYLAAEAINKTIEKTRGYPLWSSSPYEVMGFKTPALPSSIHLGEKDFQSDLHEREIDQAIRQLKSSKFSRELFEEYKNDEKRKYVFAIGNIGTLTVGQWQEIYDSNAAAQTLSNAPPYPNSLFEEDHLNETERFFLLKDIGETLKLIGNDAMDAKTIDQKKNMSIIHLALDLPVSDE